MRRGEARRYFEDVVLNYEGTECLPWVGACSRGYGVLADKASSGRKQVEIGVLICERIHGPKPTPAHECRHSCGNGARKCVTKAHVSWALHKDNVADRRVHGTENIGEKNGGGRKLTSQQAREIFDATGYAKDIAARYPVSEAMVYRIKTKKAWRDVNANRAAGALRGRW